MNDKQAAINNSRIQVKFRYNPDLVKSMRALPGREYESALKAWFLPLVKDRVEDLLKLDFELSQELRNWYVKDNAISNLPKITIPGLSITPRPYQEQGVAFIEDKKGRALVADEMGLGKTLQAIAWTRLNPAKSLPVIIVCPASVKYQWAEAIKNAVEDKTTVHVFVGNKPTFVKADYYVINYDILYVSQICPVCEGTKKARRGMEIVKCSKCKGKGKIVVVREDLLWCKANTIVFDEIHFIKDQKAFRSTASKRLASGKKHVIGLSGTPIDNRPIEIFAGLNIINPKLFPSYWKFGQRYCGATHTGFGWDFSGASNTQELFEILSSTVMIRRRKKDVLKDLPDKTKAVIPLPIDNQKAYDSAVSKFKKWLKDNPDNEAKAMVEIGHLKQAAVAGKLESCIQWIWDFLSSDEKLVVFCVHKATVAMLKKRFADMAVVIDGSVPNAKRKAIIDQFRTNEGKRLFIGNIQAVGTGVDGLQDVCSNSCTIEFDWSPKKHEQADDRLHRMGQKQAVTNWYLVGLRTIEEEIIRILDEKDKIITQVLDGKTIENNTLLTGLLNKYKK